ncbi:putative chromatin remodeling & transcription regulator BTB-POZ family [Helianthus annuus]|nr:putative chromatin remodeling & transcription regulator BTB-POZ family [Helianthus annuus]
MCRRPASPSDSVNASGDSTETYIQIVTSGGRRIPVHPNILASASTVLESIIDRPRKHRSSEKTIPIVGVPCDAVVAFVGFIYSGRCSNEEMEKYGIHLLALSHVYLVPKLKSQCTKELIQRLTIENVVDVLQLARLCDAPDLYLKCMKLVSNKFKAVEETEGWKFLQNHDPFFELEILQFIDETESRRKRSRRHRREQSLYFELSEAMDCLEHICTEGCISVGPHDMVPRKNKAPCNKFSTCQGLQLSIQHFANCKKRVNGGCVRCKQMWQLFKLHASICQLPDSACKVPLCRRFKMRDGKEMKNKKEEERWELLVKKVVVARATSSLLLPKRKRVEDDEEQEPIAAACGEANDNHNHVIRRLVC